MEILRMEPVYRFEIHVPPEAVDENHHVNNVVYVQWMQAAAIRHAQATGCSQVTAALGSSWVARMHHIEYLSPAFAGDLVTAMTWVADMRRVRSLRRYRFVRATDSVLLAQGETDWVYVDAKTGRPRAIPEAVQKLFTLVDELPESK
jgi:acyl-CoA thioester hydrolase